MKKIFIVASIIISVIACSKDNNTPNSNSIIGKWKYVGYYQNDKVVVPPVSSSSPKTIYFNQDSSYVITSQTRDSSEYGLYTVGHGNDLVWTGSLKTSDSIVFNYVGPLQTISAIPPRTEFYQIKKDSLFLFPNPKTSEKINYTIPVYKKAD